MLKLHPARLRERIGLIVLLHLAMMIVVFALFARKADVSVYRLPDPDNVALLVAAFERTPPVSHSELTRAFSDNNRLVRLVARFPAEQRNEATPPTLARFRKALGGRPFRIAMLGNDPPIDIDRPIPLSTDVIRVTVALADGRGVAIEQKVMTPAARIFGNLMLFLGSVAILDVTVILWLAAQTTRPVERLARAVREDRLDALPSHGARELVELGDTVRQLRRHLRDLLHERTQMLAAIAHDYRTYLTRLELRSEFIEDPAQRALASQDIAEMRDLLSDTLTFARESVADDLDQASCDLRVELAMIAHDRAERGEDIRIDTVAQPLLLRVSHTSFQRMLANLLDNAVRYGGGRVFVRVNIGPQTVHICVDDEGPGVPEESLQRMLEPFERLEPSRARKTGGVGLGLSIVQALAHRYHGDLRIENRRKGGFRAILVLQLAAARR